MRALSIAAVLAAVALGAAPAEAAKKFSYRYEVVEVVALGTFTAGYDDGEGTTFTGNETVTLYGLPRGRGKNCRDLPFDPFSTLERCEEFARGGLTLRSPASRRTLLNGILQTSPFVRRFQSSGTERNSSGETFRCGKDLAEDSDGFSALMRLARGGRRVQVFWNLPVAPINCRESGGSVSVEFTNVGEPSPFLKTYPLSAFRRRRVELRIRVHREWSPDKETTQATSATMNWDGRVVLRRVN
jgi:hypothetical protein